ncbi:Cysteine-rich repeat secretory protein 12 [Apostasia shenzhenica]|uniref:Cysteine-rich repeat secretory protein 12 n=1 Tax=Apostasia shenzhenica TaxID=1088818 RepID=A0A2I0AQM4_9ASPA|nr:Cysteine-rich repeat secretory protein 12 [Apostasia shenzhenica]
MAVIYMSFLLLFLTSGDISVSGDNPVLLYAGCSQSKYTPGSPYDLNVDSLLSSLSAASAFSSYVKFTAGGGGGTNAGPPVAGVFQCDGDISLSECSSCISDAISRLRSLCAAATGGIILLRSCYLRYGNDSFVGRQDTSLLYKTCSTSGNDGDGAFLAAREAAFSSLSPPAGGSYRTGFAGGVRAEAQCVGDLSARDCSDCVASAESQVKSACGGSAAGEAYLGKCYVRYSFDGAQPYDHADGGGHSGTCLTFTSGDYFFSFAHLLSRFPMTKIVKFKKNYNFLNLKIKNFILYKNIQISANKFN